MTLPAGGMLVFFALFWSAITLSFDGFIGYTGTRQLLALNYTVTDGVVLSSSVATSQGDDGTTYRPEVSFRYRVDERDLVGTRLSYDTSFSSGGEWAHRTVAALPPGASVRVHYNPANPTDSLLRPGLDGGLLFMALFMTPFNAVMFVLWAALAKSVWLKRFRPPAGGLRIEIGTRGTSIRLEGLPMLGAGLATMAALAFIGIFVIGFFAGGFHPSLPFMTGVWIFVLASGAATALWQFTRNCSDRARLVLDEGNSLIDLPPTHGRTQRLQLSTTSLIALHLTKESSTDSEGSTQTKYALALAAKDRAPERLALWSDEAQTRGFAPWLAAKLRVPLVED